MRSRRPQAGARRADSEIRLRARRPHTPTALDDLVVRPVRRGDLADVQRLLGRIADFKPQDRREAASFARHALDHPAETSFEVHVAERAGALVGYLVFGPNPLTDGVHDLYWIAVDPARERTGVGGALVAHAEARIARRGGRMVLIETSSAPEYRRQRAFYRRRGYERVARIPDFFARGEHKIIYRKIVPAAARRKK